MCACSCQVTAPGEFAHVKNRRAGWFGLTCYCNFLFCMHKSCLTWKTIQSLYSCGFWINIFHVQKLVAAGGKQFSSSAAEKNLCPKCVCVFSNACLLYFCFRSLHFFVGLSWSGRPGSRSTCSRMVVSQEAMATCCCFLGLTSGLFVAVVRACKKTSKAYDVSLCLFKQVVCEELAQILWLVISEQESKSTEFLMQVVQTSW